MNNLTKGSNTITKRANTQKELTFAPCRALKSEGLGWHAGKSFLNCLACFGCPTDTARSSSKWITKSAHVQTGVPLPQHLSDPSPYDPANQQPLHVSMAIEGHIMSVLHYSR